MNPLQRVEQHLGPIDTWPSYVIRYLFTGVPSTTAVKKLTAFFYGNDIPVSIASQLYHDCNDKRNSHRCIICIFISKDGCIRFMYSNTMMS